MQKLLETLLEEMRSTLKQTAGSVTRAYQFPKADNMIKVAMGMRRSGKTYFLFQTMRQLQPSLSLDQLLYINFEDDRILPIDHKKMGQMIDAWYTLYPENYSRTCYLFLDEIQNVEGWPVVLRRLVDTKNLQIYVTGSSSKLLSKEIATSLRGRCLSFEILPYNYLEYLSAHHLEMPSKPFGQKSLDHQQKYLRDYLKIGGFPQIQEMHSNEQRETLQNYVETVIFRDVVERYQISNITLLKYLISSLLKNAAAPFSINKFYNDIKSQGYKISKDTLYLYLSHLEDVFLVFTVPLFSESLRFMNTRPKKVYAIDNGLIVANTFNMSDNLGKLLENQVYLDFRREGKKLFYYQTSDGFEIDFITQDHQGKFELVQVVWDMDDPQTLEREKRALHQAEKELGFPIKLIDYKDYLRSFL